MRCSIILLLLMMMIIITIRNRRRWRWWIMITASKTTHGIHRCSVYRNSERSRNNNRWWNEIYRKRHSPYIFSFSTYRYIFLFPFLPLFTKWVLQKQGIKLVLLRIPKIRRNSSFLLLCILTSCLCAGKTSKRNRSSTFFALPCWYRWVSSYHTYPIVIFVFINDILKKEND